eukprot:14208415-Alexandrium_andersonii.AAC.1
MFVEHCVPESGPDAKALFSNYAPAVLDWRWGTLINTVEWFLLREAAIRRHWDVRKLPRSLQHGGDGQHAAAAAADQAQPADADDNAGRKDLKTQKLDVVHAAVTSA